MGKVDKKARERLKELQYQAERDLQVGDRVNLFYTFPPVYDQLSVLSEVTRISRGWVTLKTMEPVKSGSTTHQPGFTARIPKAYKTSWTPTRRFEITDNTPLQSESYNDRFRLNPKAWQEKWGKGVGSPELAQGGELIGKSHDNGGIPCTVDGSDYAKVEVEGKEYYISPDIIQDTTIRIYQGTNREIIDEMILDYGGSIEDIKGSIGCNLESGTIIITKPAIADKTVRKIKGTNRQVLSLINTSGGGVEIEKGGQILKQGGSVEDPDEFRMMATGGSITDLIDELDTCIVKKKGCDPMLIDEIVKNIEGTYVDHTASAELQAENVAEQREKLMGIMEDPATRILVAFSGGKDSVAMALHLHFNMGIPAHRIELHHHDVDGEGEPLFDWATTTQYCQKFADHFGFPLLFSYREGGIVRGIFRENEPDQDVMYQREPGGDCYRIETNPNKTNTRRKFPAVSADLQTRWCSGLVKIDVFKKIITNDPSLSEDSTIVFFTGERRAESPARSKYKEIQMPDSMNAPTKNRRVYNWRLVIDWTDKEVWSIMRKHKVQPHPAYELGWSRCSCQTCIFNSPNIWASVKKISPHKIDRISEIEQDINFSLYSKKVTKKPGEYYGESINMENLVAGTNVKYISKELGTERSGKIMEIKKEGKRTYYMIKMSAKSGAKTVSGEEKIFWKKIVSITSVSVQVNIPIHQYADQGESPLSDVDLLEWSDQATKDFTKPIIVDKWIEPSGARSDETAGAS